MDTNGLTIVEAAKALGVSTKTIRRAIAKFRGVVGPVAEGVLVFRGRSVAFRQLTGVRNDEYHLWLDTDAVPDATPNRLDPAQAILDRLAAVERAITELRARVDQMAGGAGPR